MTTLHLNEFQVINSCFFPPHWPIMHYLICSTRIIQRCTYFIDVHIVSLNTTSFGHKGYQKVKYHLTPLCTRRPRHWSKRQNAHSLKCVVVNRKIWTTLYIYEPTYLLLLYFTVLLRLVLYKLLHIYGFF